MYLVNSCSTVASCFFEGNTGHIGGAIYARDGTNLSLIGNNNFNENIATRLGGAIACKKCWVTLLENNTFYNNFCNDTGGAINVKYGNIFISGNTSFANNVALNGGGISLLDSNATINGTAVEFRENVANCTGGGIRIINSRSRSRLIKNNITIVSASFIYNRGQQGGAVYVLNQKNLLLSDIIVIGNSYYSSTFHTSAATHTSATMEDTLCYEDCNHRGGAITSICSKVTFRRRSIVEYNQYAFRLESSTILFEGFTSISNNMQGGYSSDTSTVWSGNTSITTLIRLVVAFLKYDMGVLHLMEPHILLQIWHILVQSTL